MRVDQLFGNGALLHENAEPAEGVDPLVGLEAVLRYGGAAHPVIAVAAGDEIAPDFASLAVFHIGYARAFRVEIVDGDVLRLERQRGPC